MVFPYAFGLVLIFGELILLTSFESLESLSSVVGLILVALRPMIRSFIALNRDFFSLKDLSLGFILGILLGCFWDKVSESILLAEESVRASMPGLLILRL